jgi:hypothetical protein
VSYVLGGWPRLIGIAEEEEDAMVDEDGCVVKLAS